METLTYEQTRELEQKKIKEDRKKLEKVLAALGYAVRRDVDDKGWQAYARADGFKGDSKIYLRANDYGHKGKIHVSGGYPRAKDGSYHGDIYKSGTRIPQPSINVSFDKDIPTIVKDIERRFMPAHSEYLASVLARIGEHEEYRNAVADTLSFVLGESLEVETGRSEAGFSLENGIWGTVRAFGEDVNIEAHSVSKKTARRIMDILKAEPKKEEKPS